MEVAGSFEMSGIVKPAASYHIPRDLICQKQC